MAKTVDELWEDIQFDKKISLLAEERKVNELMELLVKNGGLERLLELIREGTSSEYRIWEIISILPEPPMPKWEIIGEDREYSESFSVWEWERMGREFLRTHKVTRVEPVVCNGKAYIKAYYIDKVRRRVLVNQDEIVKWVNSLSEESRNFIVKLYDLVMEKNFEWQLWLNNGDRDLTLVECYWKLWKKFKPTIYRADEVWEDDHDREPYGHWVR